MSSSQYTGEVYIVKSMVTDPATGERYMEYVEYPVKTTQEPGQALRMAAAERGKRIFDQGLKATFIIHGYTMVYNRESRRMEDPVQEPEAELAEASF